MSIAKSEKDINSNIDSLKLEPLSDNYIKGNSEKEMNRKLILEYYENIKGKKEHFQDFMGSINESNENLMEIDDNKNEIKIPLFLEEHASKEKLIISQRKFKETKNVENN